ncbi:MAG: hypothetical protein RL318_2577 [Fibrobacterota bacterium]
MLTMVGLGKPTMPPNALKQRIQVLPSQRLVKVQPGDLRFNFCPVRTSMAEELEHLLGKCRKYVLNEHLRPMVGKASLKLPYLEIAMHPNHVSLALVTNALVLTRQKPTMVDVKPTMLTMVGSGRPATGRIRAPPLARAGKACQASAALMPFFPLPHRHSREGGNPDVACTFPGGGVLGKAGIPGAIRAVLSGSPGGWLSCRGW